jgi:phosphate transport system protein
MHRPHPHVDRVYEAELQHLGERLLSTAHRAEDMVKEAVRALQNRDPELARAVVRQDGDLDRLEVETDQLCVAMLARRSPVGEDLRFVTAALKCVIDLERIGDLAGNIAKRAVEIMAVEGLEPPGEVVELQSGTVELVSKAVRALETRDAALAREVKAQDNRLDKLNKEVFRRMIAHAKDHPEALEGAFAYTSVSRYLERVGDHAVNVAEMVVFLVEGKVVRHAPMERATG